MYFLYVQLTATAGDPHFSIMLLGNQRLCYNIHGQNNTVFNLISCNEFFINAKFISDSHREGVTWIESIGVVFTKTLEYEGYDVNHIKIDAETFTIQIGDKFALDAGAVRILTLTNGTILIVEGNRYLSPFQYPAVQFHLTDVGLHFIVKFYADCLDIFWLSAFNGVNCHGLVGEPLCNIF